MRVSQYAAVLETDGKPMSVRTALQLINRFLAEDDFDYDTQFCLHWFETQGWAEGQYGQADVLARAKGTSVQGMQAACVLSGVLGDRGQALLRIGLLEGGAYSVISRIEVLGYPQSAAELALAEELFGGSIP